MTYFVDSICGVDTKSIVPESSVRVIFRAINSDVMKPKKCAANKIITNASGEVIAVRCNCGKKTYHPAIEGKAFWYNLFSKKQIRLFRTKNIKTEKLLTITEDFG